MKYWYARILFLVVIVVSLTTLRAQDLSGYWQGVEHSPDDILGPNTYWPTSVTIVQRGNIFGGTYFEYADINQQYYGLLKVTDGFVQNNVGSFDIKSFISTNSPPRMYVCTGTVKFTYYPDEEKIIGLPLYRDCPSTSQVELYRIRLKSDSSFCQGNAMNLLVTGKDVRWYADQGKKHLLHTGSAYQPQLDSTTTLYVTQTIHAAESPVAPLTIRIFNPQIRQIHLVNATCQKETGSLRVEAIGSAKLQYRLNGSVFQSSPIFTDLKPDQYHLTVQDDHGCQVSQTAQLDDDCQASIYLPTAFSPNGDGLNEDLAVYFPFSSLILTEITVFDRWGSLVYYSNKESHLTSGDKVWSDLSANPPLSAGIYSCCLKVKMPSGMLYNLSRSIELIR